MLTCYKYILYNWYILQVKCTVICATWILRNYNLYFHFFRMFKNIVISKPFYVNQYLSVHSFPAHNHLYFIQVYSVLWFNLDNQYLIHKNWTTGTACFRPLFLGVGHSFMMEIRSRCCKIYILPLEKSVPVFYSYDTFFKKEIDC